MRSSINKITVLLAATAATVTLAPSASATPRPNFALCVQLADGGGNTELGAEQCTKFVNFGPSASLFACDANCFDPDAIRINLRAAFGGGQLNPGIDFRACGQADDNGKELGAVQCTDWASGGGGKSGRISDFNGFDPDRYRVFLETRPLPPGAGFTDWRFSVETFDRGEGNGMPAFTGWASENGGPSRLAVDQNQFDFDGIVLGLEVV
ncbi:hypothetical protein LWC34_10205 [Kibdelosporangium philippinense]|uniref:Uncharacterized protein n=1 Tax=Kibdelosporangium philippinense TaxID=211113 RepID=A0ABS8Z5W6_9PSEU|nr:hypothetical protein [Kibdelosporangium philippinense]MCE7003200.1 hypothetical protein [Kibdelosporangium philippinense]